MQKPISHLLEGINSKEKRDQAELEFYSRGLTAKDLFSLYKNSELGNKAFWVLSSIVEKNPTILTLQDGEALVEILKANPSQGIERNIWRIFQFIQIPHSIREKCLHLAFETLENKHSSIAVQVFSMSTAYQLSQGNKDLEHLLKEILLFKLPNSSPGFQSKSKKILKKL